MTLLLLFALVLDPWAQLAQRDLRAMHDQIVANHPGPADRLNPAFRQWLEGGFKTSMARAAEVKTFPGYVAAVRWYAAGFRDGHLSVFFNVVVPQASWPGFTIALRQDRYVVHAVDSNDASLPPKGAELTECDGRPVKAILDEDVWPFVSGAKYDALDVAIAPALLIDRGNPWMKRPATCRFRVGNELREYPIGYRRTTNEQIGKLNAAAGAVREQLPPVRSVNGGVWVSIPSFDDSDAANLDRLKQLVEASSQWRSAPFVVFDLRGNNGGNSYWGNQIVRGLYGDRFYEAMVSRVFGPEAVEWRVSPDNIEHVKGIARNARARAGEDAAKQWDVIAGGMAAAQTPLYRERDVPAADANGDTKPAYNGRVFLLTDWHCGSACLDFADRVRSLPNATHAGQTTNADSVYMEVRGVTLPSGIASLNLPVKVFRNRPRGHNEAYVPAAPNEGDINDTAAVEKWLLGHSVE